MREIRSSIVGRLVDVTGGVGASVIS